MKKETLSPVKIGGDASQELHCSQCDKKGHSDTFYTVQDHEGNDVYLCPECREVMNQKLADQTKNPNYVGALILGLIGAAIGGAVWVGVALWSGREIGYISIGLGYLVGLGVHFGSGRKLGIRLQALSGFIAIFGILATEYALFYLMSVDYIKTHSLEVGIPEGTDINSVLANISPWRIDMMLSADFFQFMISPISVLIYVIGIYVAYSYCKQKKI